MTSHETGNNLKSENKTFFFQLYSAGFFVNFNICLLVLLSSAVIKVEAWKFLHRAG